MEEYDHHYPTEDIAWQQEAAETTARIFLMGLEGDDRDRITDIIIGHHPDLEAGVGKEWMVALVLLPQNILQNMVHDVLRYSSGEGTVGKPLLLVLTRQELSALNQARRKVFWPVTPRMHFELCDNRVIGCTLEEREKILGELNIFNFTTVSSINPTTLEQKPSPF